jgi:hypothetical protein
LKIRGVNSIDDKVWECLILKFIEKGYDFKIFIEEVRDIFLLLDRVDIEWVEFIIGVLDFKDLRLGREE